MYKQTIKHVLKAHFTLPMHLSFVSTTPGRAGIPGGFDNKFVPERRTFDKKMQPESRAIDKRAKNDETGSQSI